MERTIANVRYRRKAATEERILQILASPPRIRGRCPPRRKVLRGLLRSREARGRQAPEAAPRTLRSGPLVPPELFALDQRQPSAVAAAEAGAERDHFRRLRRSMESLIEAWCAREDGRYANTADAALASAADRVATRMRAALDWTEESKV
jgi:hypothetical protein